MSSRRAREQPAAEPEATRAQPAREEPPAATPSPSPSERAPDFLWAGRPVYRCRVCGDRFELMENLGGVLRHEAEIHAATPLTVRESPILGPRGETLMVEEVTVGTQEG